MKAILFLGVLSTLLLACSGFCPVAENATFGVSMEDAVGQGMISYEEFMNTVDINGKSIGCRIGELKNILITVMRA